MTSIDRVRMGLKNLWRRKVRTILTVLGVVIGTASIVVMLSLGIGMNESNKKSLEQMGSLNVIDVDIYYMPPSEEGQVIMSKAMPQNNKIDDEAIAKIAEMEGVEAVTPLLRTYLKFISGKYESYIPLIGVYPETLDDFDFEVQKGTLLTGEVPNEVLFGSGIAQQFRNPRQRMSRYYYMYDGMQEEEAPVDLMEDRIKMTFDMSYGNRYPGGSQGTRRPKIYTVNTSGIIAQSRDEKDYQAYMDLNDLKKLIQDNQRTQKSQGGRGQNDDLLSGYEQAKVKVSDLKYVQSVQDAINEMGYGARSLTDILEAQMKQTETLRMILGGIGAVAFLVAAIGIANTMLMSIYERTREIGIMKVLGCMLKDIKKLFLFEAGMIGALGGILGIAFSKGASFILNRADFDFMGGGSYMMRGEAEAVPVSIIPAWLMLVSIVFAILVGLIAGYYPARRAMKLSALEAIRTE